MACSVQERHRGLRFLPEDGEPAVREITVILVSWNDADEARACVETLAAASHRIAPGGPRVSLVVVSNGGDLPGATRIGSPWPDARLVVNETNRGLAPAANQGAAVATGDVLLFLNPDTRAEGDPYSEIARAFAENPEAVAVAPRLLDAVPAGWPVGSLAAPDREDQFTFQLRRLPSLSSDARQLLLIDHLRPNSSGRRRDRYADNGRETPFVVEQAAGAALAVRKKAFCAVGGFDEQFAPGWFEDVDLCARLAREGTILFWPHARFRHSGGVSARQLGYDRFLPIYYRNALRYRERYSPPERLLYRVLLVTGMLLRLAALPLRPTVPRPRAEAALAYWRTLLVAFERLPRSCPL